MSESFNMGQSPLSVLITIQILSKLCSEGEVHVINCPIDPSAVHRVLHFLNNKLSEADKEWIRLQVAGTARSQFEVLYHPYEEANADSGFCRHCGHERNLPAHGAPRK